MSEVRLLSDAPWLASGPAARVLGLLNADGEEARVIGGAVRNALMGLPEQCEGEIELAGYGKIAKPIDPEALFRALSPIPRRRP